MTAAEAPASGTRPLRFNETGEMPGLGAWARLFFRYPNARIITAVLVITVAARLAVGGWRRLDLVVAAAFVLVQPFTEWFIHVFVLHFRVKHVARRTVDLFIARKHRAHHVDPVDIPLTFVAMPALIGLVVGVAALTFAGFRDVHLALTACVTGYALLFTYEWMHYLIHSTYVPRSAPYRTVWRAHRLHHFKNEHFWFGVTNPIGDIVLRTYPDRATVATSHTARNIGAT